MLDEKIRERMESTYYDVLKLIHMQVNRLVGDGVTYNREQALSDANLAFVKAYHNYQLDKAMFNTHVGFRVHMSIISEFRRLYRKPRPLTFSELDELGQAQVDHKLSVKPQLIEKELPKWTELLSQDAKTVIELVLNPPKDIGFFMKERGSNSNRTFRSCIKEFLGYLGWKKKRIINAFDEIKQTIRNK